MHLLCRDTECVGNDLPAGDVEDVSCRYCGRPLESAEGNVLAQGVAPVVDGEPPSGFNALMDAMREAGHEVRVIDLTAVVQDGRLLVSSVDEDGNLLSAEVCEAERAEEVMRVMELMA